MLSARYNTPASDWTRGIDAALAEWSNQVNGDAVFDINLAFDGTSNLLASTFPSFVSVGDRWDGVSIQIPRAAAKLQGYAAPGADMLLSINPNQPFSFSGPTPGRYSFIDVMKHELSHGLFASEARYGYRSPYELFIAGLPSGAMKDGTHPNEAGSLLSPNAYLGQGQTWGPFDWKAMSASGLPTKGDDTFYLVPGARLSSTGGNDKAIWLDTFDKYNAILAGIGTLEMQGKSPLTPSQQDLYRLYRAAFSRTPDLAGYQWWDKQNRSFPDTVAAFGNSPEFTNKYGQSQSRRDYIGTLYRNILGRDPERAGVDYWDSRSDLDRTGLMANIALAPENKIGIPTFTL